jgi:magnesium transporter
MAKIKFPRPSIIKSRVDYSYDQPGSLPGTLLIDADAPPPNIVLYDYNATDSTCKQVAIPEECTPI